MPKNVKWADENEDEWWIASQNMYLKYMGVAGLLKNILQRHQNVHRPVSKQENFDEFYIDFNGIVYDAFYSLDFSVLKTTQEIEQALINEVIKTLKTMITELITPQKLCYIAVDGSVPAAKMVQQRTRRYKKVLEDELKQTLRKKYPEVPHSRWDTSKISPGTEFMDQLDKQLKKAIKNREFHSHAPTMKLHYSSCYVPGEGEHKFMPVLSNLKDENTKRICIYSNDGDMLMLSAKFPTKRINIMVTTNKNEALRREYETVPYALIDISKINTGVHEALAPGLQKDAVLRDYICFQAMGGNDFVKAFPFTHIREKGVEETFIRIYRDLLVKLGNQPLVEFDPHEKNSIPVINRHFLTEFIGQLAKIEQESLQHHQRKTQNSKPDKLSPEQKEREAKMEPWQVLWSKMQHGYAYKSDSPFYKKYGDLFGKIDYFAPERTWKMQYYDYFFGIKWTGGGAKSTKTPKITKNTKNTTKNTLKHSKHTKNTAKPAKTVRDVCVEWLKSFVFALVYYLHASPPSWTFSYQLRAAPLPSDIYRVLTTENLNEIISFELGEPFTPLVQQMLILPPQNDILPDMYKKLMREGELARYYPEKFELDFMEGGKYIYSEPILPAIDYNVVKDACEKIRPDLPEKNRNRNRLNKNANVD